jgi:hypothetical protein
MQLHKIQHTCCLYVTLHMKIMVPARQMEVRKSTLILPDSYHSPCTTECCEVLRYDCFMSASTLFLIQFSICDIIQHKFITWVKCSILSLKFLFLGSIYLFMQEMFKTGYKYSNLMVLLRGWILRGKLTVI